MCGIVGYIGSEEASKILLTGLRELEYRGYDSAGITEGELSPHDINEEQFSRSLSLSESPAPELIIRTGGEMRISNFLLWEASQTELFFTPTLWPDFDGESLDEAVAAFQS